MAEDKKIILPDGSDVRDLERRMMTARSKQRQKEDEDYVPVIIKRTDEVLKHPDDILEKAIKKGVEQLERPFVSLVLSSVAAGLILSFVPMLVGSVAGLLPEDSSLQLSRLMMAAVYPLGFIICVISGTQLFTEHTATAIYPILDLGMSVKKLFRLWAVVLFGNLIGTFVGANLLAAAENVIQVGNGYEMVASHILHAGPASLLISAILAGWLMAQGAWLLVSTPNSLSQIACIYIVTFIIGIGGLHHSIAGSAEVFIAYLMSSSFGLVEIFQFIAIAVFGNLVGGSLFVGVLNYGHIRKTQKLPQDSRIA